MRDGSDTARSAHPTAILLLGLLGVLLALWASVAPVRLAQERLETPKIVVEYGESILMVGAEDLRRSGLAALYPASWDDPPLRANPYPPVMYAIWAVLAGLLDHGPDHLPGRLIASAGWMLWVGMIYGIPRRLGAGRAFAATAALAFLLAPLSAEWLVVGRVDVPGASLGALGLWLLLGKKGRGGSLQGARFWGVALVFAAGLGFKQSLLAAVLAGLGHLVLERRFGEAGQLAALLAVLGGGVVVALEVLSGGGFTRNAIGAVLNPLDPVAGLIQTLEAASAMPLPLLASLYASPLLLLGWKGPVRLVTLYTITSLGLCALTVGKVGANTNYLLEPTAVLFLAAPLGLGVLASRLSRTRVAPAALWIPALGTLLLGSAALLERGSVARRYEQAVAARHQIPSSIPVPEVEGYVLMNPALLPLTEVPLSRLYWNDPYTFSSFAAFGTLDPAGLVGDLATGTIGAIVENHPLEAEPLGEPRWDGDFEKGWGPWWVESWREQARASFRRDRSRPSPFFLYRFRGRETGAQ